ncbi:MAG: TRAP transporter substrate-binding protein [Peptoniphilaceae bacterium]|nr:TRAP transporter substrate-binding protein [Peptoniphilaceae bacterium]MDY6018053.1 TRAP transporter substrate-binding protein [Anaerococcus sp.]
MKKILKLVPLFVLSILLVSCNNYKEADVNLDTINTDKANNSEIVLSAGELNSLDSIMGQMLQKYSDIVYKKSKGRIYIELYASGQLGDERSQMQAVQMGALDIFRANTIFVGDFGAKKLNLFGLPYLFSSREHLWKVLDSDIGTELMNDMVESNLGMRGLCYLEEGSRHFFVANKKIEKPEDLKGLKLRVSETSILLDTVKALGASPTPLSFGELYTSLQTGVVDGAEQPITGYYSNSFYEVAPNFVLDSHTYSPGMLVISDRTWNKLDSKDQKILLAAGKELEKYNKKFTDKEEKNLLDKLKNKGIDVVKPDDLSEWQAKVEPIYEKYGSDYKKLINEIRDMEDK